MNLFNIIDTIYESKHFPTILTIAIIVLIVLFTSVTILGVKDAKRSKEPKKSKKDELLDITFDTPKEEPEPIKEDVTFEIPILTQNLENFKKNLEEEIEREEKINVIKEAAIKEEETKKKKILDKKAIESTDVLPIIEDNKEDIKVDNNIKKKEEQKPKHKEVLKEIFKDRKEVEPPKLKEEPITEPKKVVESKKEEKAEQKKLDLDISMAKVSKTIQKNNTSEVKKEVQKQPENSNQKKSPRYSGDDDF